MMKGLIDQATSYRGTGARGTGKLHGDAMDEGNCWTNDPASATENFRDIKKER